MRIVALVENTTKRNDMHVEHGLSLYVETDKHKVLFDMGETDFFYENAKTLGIELADVDVAIVSHGHSDHGGGLGKFLEINDRALAYVHKDAFLPHYNANGKYIGLDVSLKSNPRIIFTEDERRVDDDITLYTCNKKHKKFPMSNVGLSEMVGNKYITDDFRHEQYMLIEEEGKKILFSGCSHKGILNVMNWFSPDVLVGGFHFSKFPLDDKLKEVSLELATYHADLYTCHCTGKEQYAFMCPCVPSLNYLSCGQEIEIGEK